jgi:hypothetical protein
MDIHCNILNLIKPQIRNFPSKCKSNSALPETKA